MKRKLVFGSYCLLVAAILLGARVAQAEPDEDKLGKAANYPVGSLRDFLSNEQYRVGSWSALHQVPGVRVRTVARSSESRPLPRAAQPPAITYSFNNEKLALKDYMARQRTTGLLVLKNGEIVAEQYGYGRQEDARFLSMSMAKSVTSLLIGQAVERGQIASLDDVAGKYVKELAGSPYGGTKLRHLLRMSSGLTFTERYDGRDDIARLMNANTGAPGAGNALDVLRSITDRHSPPGEKFAYASAETEILGRVLVAATGKSIAALTHEWLWQPLGAEHEAYWRIAADGQEITYAAFNASLRDWGRLGLLLAQNGKVGERQLVSPEYLLDATDLARQPPAGRPLGTAPNLGYGYHFWLMPLRERTFLMMGIYGQAVYVQPASGIVMVITSVWAHPTGARDPRPWQERDALWRGVLASLGGSTAE